MNIQEIKQLLHVTIPANLPVMITGSPGIGKSDVVEQVCEEMKIDLMVCHPVTSDPVDYKGMPTVQNGLADFIPFGDLKRMMDAKEPLVVFIDDLGQAPQAVQAAIMQLPQAREINGKAISDFVTFLAATNRKQDKAGVSGILEPLKSRFIIVELTADIESWISWAIRKKMPPELMAFSKFRPDLLDNFIATADMTNSPCPRTVAKVGELMIAGLPRDLWYETFKGCTGEGWTAEFIGFIDIFKTLPDLKEIEINPSTVPIPTSPATLYALCSVLAQRATSNNITSLFIYLERMPLEFQVVLVKDLNDINKGVLNTKSYINWTAKNTDVFI